MRFLKVKVISEKVKSESEDLPAGQPSRGRVECEDVDLRPDAASHLAPVGRAELLQSGCRKKLDHNSECFKSSVKTPRNSSFVVELVATLHFANIGDL